MNSKDRFEIQETPQPTRTPEQLEAEAYQAESDAATLLAQAEGKLINAQNMRVKALELRRKMIQESPEKNARFEMLFMKDQRPTDSSNQIPVQFNPQPGLA